MICPRCGQKYCQIFELRITFPSGNGEIREICSACAHDIIKFVDKVPKYNIHGYNLIHEDMAKECDTMKNRGIMKEWESEEKRNDNSET